MGFGSSDIQTAEDAMSRIAEISAERGEEVVMETMESCFQGIPPEICSTLFPQNFLPGQELPDQAGSYATLQGVYSSGAIAEAGKESFFAYNPAARYTPDSEATVMNTFAAARDNTSIESLVTSYDVKVEPV